MSPLKLLAACAIASAIIAAPAAWIVRADASTTTTTATVTITGTVRAVSSGSMSVYVPEHGPGFSHGPGIHSMLIIAARTYIVDTTKAAYRTADGKAVAKPHLVIGDQVTVIGQPWQNGMVRASAVIVPTPAKPKPVTSPARQSAK